MNTCRGSIHKESFLLQIYGVVFLIPIPGRTCFGGVFQRCFGEVFRGRFGSVSGPCFSNLDNTFGKVFRECVSVQCFGMCFGMQTQDPKTPLWPKVASGDQISFETPFETHPFQSPAIFFFLLGRGRVHLPQWAGCPRRSGGTPPPPPPDELNSNPAEPAAAWAS